jgi:hypothetical protein
MRRRNFRYPHRMQEGCWGEVAEKMVGLPAAGEDWAVEQVK